MSPCQLFTCRRELRKEMKARGVTLPVSSAPAPLRSRCDRATPSPEVTAVAKRPSRQPRSPSNAVELEIDGVAARIARGADRGWSRQ